MKRIICGALCWPVDAFWKASLVDLHDVLDGWNEVHGAPSPGRNAPTREELEDLKRRYPGTTSVRAKANPETQNRSDPR